MSFEEPSEENPLSCPACGYELDLPPPHSRIGTFVVATAASNTGERFDLRALDPKINERTREQLEKQQDLERELLKRAKSDTLDADQIERIASERSTDRYVVEVGIVKLSNSGKLKFDGKGYTTRTEPDAGKLSEGTDVRGGSRGRRKV